MMSRFFVYGTLPPLEFGSRPDLSSRALMELYDLNLSRIALKKIYVLKLWIDVSNIYGLFQDEGFDGRWNYSKSTIKALIANEEDLPEYVLAFFQQWETEAERKNHFAQLIAQYFEEEIKKNRGYLRDFLTFEHDMRVLLVGFRAKIGGHDVARELQFEDMHNPTVATVLLQKDRMGQFQFPMEYEDLEIVLESAGSDPSKQYEAVARFRFEFYSKYFVQHPFSLKGIVAYMVALWILEDLFVLKSAEGERLLSNIVERENVS